MEYLLGRGAPLPSDVDQLRNSLPRVNRLMQQKMQGQITSQLLSSAVVLGREKEVEMVFNLMLQPGDRSSNEVSSSSSRCAKRRKIGNSSVLLIVGIGGMGETTLAQ